MDEIPWFEYDKDDLDDAIVFAQPLQPQLAHAVPVSSAAGAFEEGAACAEKATGRRIPRRREPSGGVHLAGIGLEEKTRLGFGANGGCRAGRSWKVPSGERSACVLAGAGSKRRAGQHPVRQLILWAGAGVAAERAALPCQEPGGFSLGHEAEP
ncbi:hypothetical protein ACR820_34760 [Streptomyces netropsis]